MDLDEDLFCRDWLGDPYFDIINNAIKEQNVTVGEFGLEITNEIEQDNLKKGII